MRRFSQRNSLVTLSEINITPLLDLAFVLLIIFIITTPLLEKSLSVNLAKGGSDAKIDRENLKTVEISAAGVFALDRMRMTPNDIERKLVEAFKQNPKIIVAIRADKNGKTDYLMDMINRCQRNGITKFYFNTEPVR
jgi:biopolymer transport protein ExbD